MYMYTHVRTFLEDVFVEGVSELALGVEVLEQRSLDVRLEVAHLERLERRRQTALVDVLGRQVLLHVVHLARVCTCMQKQPSVCVYSTCTCRCGNYICVTTCKSYVVLLRLLIFLTTM